MVLVLILIKCLTTLEIGYHTKNRAWYLDHSVVKDFL